MKNDGDFLKNSIIENHCKNLNNDYNYLLLKHEIKFSHELSKDCREELSKIIKFDYLNNGNVLSGEKYLEQMANYSLYFKSEDIKKALFKNLKKDIKNIRKELESKLNDSYQPNYAFALGKNLLFFGESY